MLRSTALILTAALSTAAGTAVASPLETDLYAFGAVAFDDTDVRPFDGPMWVEVVGYVDPRGLASCSVAPCVPAALDGLSWSGPVDLGHHGTWSGRLSPGEPALESLEPAPRVELDDDFALRITAHLPTTPDVCDRYCDAVDDQACLDTCTAPDTWAISGTTWLSTGGQHATLRGPEATVVAPRIELEALVDRSGQPIDWERAEFDSENPAR